MMRKLNEIIRKLLVGQTNNAFVQLLRYFFVGGVAFVVDFGLLAVLTEYASMPYLLSACFGFMGGLATNYLMSIRWVFNKGEQSGTSALVDFIVFALIGVMGLFFNAVIMYVSTEIVGVHYLMSKIISTILVFAWNFIARRLFIEKANLICRLIKLKPQV